MVEFFELHMWAFIFDSIIAANRKCFQLKLNSTAIKT